MNKEIKIEKTEQCTIYVVGVSDKYRIVQNSDDQFIIQKLYKETQTKGYLWWKKTTTSEVWKSVDKNGMKYYSVGIGIHISNSHLFKTYKTLEKAVKWIEDYNKYPIYH
ncbi:MAG: hypothetical protein HN704_18030 [Bacteroidetes bacterium]|jgi:hypothetical protein|nr:hypothetical protein [Bacteroidota bacterium]